MSLNTVLQIGKVIRSSDDSLKFFKYIKPYPKNKDFSLCVTIPINGDFTLNWNKAIVTPQKEYDDLYYLQFKTSDSDSSMKYIFGDVYYEKSAKIKKDRTIEKTEGGYYRLNNSTQSNGSFIRGNEDFNDIISFGKKENKNITLLVQFRKSLEKDINILERILEYPSAIEFFSQML